MKKFISKLKIVLVLIFYHLFSFGQPAQKLNILFIAVDDLKTNIGCFGDTIAYTPSLDALAEKGMVFSHAYCQQAVCAPSRASLLTSQYPDQTKVWDLSTLIRDMNPNIVTLPQYFKQNGYRTAGVGKIFDYRSVNDDDPVSWSVPFANPYSQSLYNIETGKPVYWYADSHAKDTLNLLIAEAQNLGVNEREYALERHKPSTECADVPYDAYIDGAIAKVGMQLLEDASESEKPFFVAVGFQRPHLPFNAPKEFWDLYDRETFQLAEYRDKAENSPDIAYHNWGELRDYTDIPKSGNLTDEKQLHLIHAYYAATSYIDFLIGELTDKLEALGLAENTAIVVWGDHGWHLGDHNLWCKHSNFEEATHAPLIISYPGQKNAGITYSSPVEFTDIAPTLCELTGNKIPAYFEGESLMQAIQSPNLPIRTGSLSQYPRNDYMGYSLRTERYRYTKWVDKESKSHYTSELYDYETDPLETKNFVYDTQYLAVKDSLDKIVTERIKVPSTQHKIKFKINSTGSSGETQGINDCPIQLDGYELKTNPKGEATFTHVDGSYAFKIKPKGFQTVEGELEVTKDTIIQMNLDAEYYNTSFQVMGSWNNKALNDVFVNFNNEIKQTDSLGMVNFQEIPYKKYSAIVEMANGFSQTFSDIEVYSDTTIILTIERPSFAVKIQVIDIYSELNIYNTSVSLNDITFVTDTKGTATFNEIEGTYKLNIQNEVYQNILDSVFIYSDTILIYKLVPSYASVKFKIKENTTPVNNAVIYFANDSMITSALGMASFYDVPVPSSNEYYVKKTGFKTLNGNLYARRDTIVNLQMEKTTTLISEHYKQKIHIWPNPAKKKLHIEVPPELGLLKTSIFSITGQEIISKNCSPGYGSLDITSIKNGIYLITLESATNNYLNKLIRINN